MKTVTRRLRFATNPLVLAVALGLLGANVLGDEEDEFVLNDRTPGPTGTDVAAQAAPSSSTE